MLRRQRRACHGHVFPFDRRSQLPLDEDHRARDYFFLFCGGGGGGGALFFGGSGGRYVFWPSIILFVV